MEFVYVICHCNQKILVEPFLFEKLSQSPRLFQNGFLAEARHKGPAGADCSESPGRNRMPEIGPVKECTDYRSSCAPYECGSPITGALSSSRTLSIPPLSLLIHVTAQLLANYRGRQVLSAIWTIERQMFFDTAKRSALCFHDLCNGSETCDCMAGD